MLCPLLQCRPQHCKKAGGLFKEVLQLSDTVALKTLIPLPTLDFSYYSNYLYRSDCFKWKVYMSLASKLWNGSECVGQWLYVACSLFSRWCTLKEWRCSRKVVAPEGTFIRGLWLPGRLGRLQVPWQPSLEETHARRRGREAVQRQGESSAGGYHLQSQPAPRCPCPWAAPTGLKHLCEIQLWKYSREKACFFNLPPHKHSSFHYFFIISFVFPFLFSLKLLKGFYEEG